MIVDSDILDRMLAAQLLSGLLSNPDAVKHSSFDELVALARELADKIKQPHTSTGWISILEHLPPEDETVLVSAKSLDTGLRNADVISRPSSGPWKVYGGTEPVYHVTHWQPIEHP